MPTTFTRSRKPADRGPQRMRYTVRDFYRMGDAGVFNPERRYELLDGDIILMQPIGESHADKHDWLNEALVAQLAGRYRIRTQNPIRLDSFSEPLPDFAILKLRKDGYRTAHPGPGDTLLIIELAASSIGYDIGKKQRAYAKAGIPEYWVVDLIARQLHVFRKPSAIGYAHAQVLESGEEVESATVKKLRFAVAELVGS